MWTKQRNFSQSNNIGRSPNASFKVPCAMLFFQVSRGKNSLKINKRSDSPFHLDSVVENFPDSYSNFGDIVKSTQQVIGYFGCFESIHMGQKCLRCGSAHVNQMSMSSCSLECVTEVGLGLYIFQLSLGSFSPLGKQCLDL